MTSSTNVVIIYGDQDSTLAVGFRLWESLGIQKIWITTSQWDFTTNNRDFTINSSYRTLAFAHHHGEISSFKFFLQTLNPLKYSEEYLATLEWMKLNCEVTAYKCKTMKNCLSNDSLQWLKVQTLDMALSDNSYDIYNAVYTLAYALHDMFLQQVHNQPMDNMKETYVHCSKVVFLFFSFCMRCDVINAIIFDCFSNNPIYWISKYVIK